MKLVSWVLVAVLAGLALLAAFWLTRPAAAPTAREAAVPPTVVRVERPTRRNLVRSVELPGDVNPWREAALYAKVSGYLREVRVDKGDRVAAGQLLATIESPELERDAEQARDAFRASRAAVLTQGAQLARARADREAAAADVGRARTEELRAAASLKSARADLDLQRATWERLSRVAASEPGMVPGQDLDVARNRVRDAEARLEAARQALAAARQGVLAARSRLAAAGSTVEAAAAQVEGAALRGQADRSAADRAAGVLEYTLIRAPFSGVITARYLDPGALVQSAAGSAQGSTRPVLRLSDSSRLRVAVQVPESEVPGVRVGTEAEVRSDALPDTVLRARVTRLSGALDAASRSMLAEIELPNRGGLLKPGMLARARLFLEAHRGVLVVPTGAVVPEKDKRFVFVVEGGVARKRMVVTGFEEPEAVEIREGLAASDAVIVSGAGGLVDGTRVVARRAGE